MGKGSGGTRNYRTDAKRYATRLSEFQSLISSGIYDKTRSYFDESGGFYVTHINHNPIDDASVDKSDVAIYTLAKKGYKIYLDSERSTIQGLKMPDGRIYDAIMDIKTVNTAGNYSVESGIKKAAKQIMVKEQHGVKYKKHAVILYQNTPDADKKYMIKQIQNFFDKAPSSLQKYVDVVIVVGTNGHVHRHYRNKKRRH